MNNSTNESPIVLKYVYSQQEERGFIVAIHEGLEPLVLAKQGSYGVADCGWHSLQPPVVGDWQKIEDVKGAYGISDFDLMLMEVGNTDLINPHYRETLKEHFEYLLKVQTECKDYRYIYTYDYNTNEINYK